MEQPFSTTDLSAILERHPRLVTDWTEMGIFLADLRQAHGYASRRQFSYEAVLRAHLAVYLHDTYGFKRAKLKTLMESLWNREFFKQWATAFPDVQPILDKDAGLEKILMTLQEEGAYGGSLLICDPYGDCNIMYWPLSFASILATAIRKGAFIATRPEQHLSFKDRATQLRVQTQMHPMPFTTADFTEISYPVLEGGGSLLKTLTGMQDCLIVNLYQLKRQIDERIARLP